MKFKTLVLACIVCITTQLIYAQSCYSSSNKDAIIENNYIILIWDFDRVQIGELLDNKIDLDKLKTLEIDKRIENIFNCSYSKAKDLITITAINKETFERELKIFDRKNNSTATILKDDNLYHASISASGEYIAYSILPKEAGNNSSLYIYNNTNKISKLLVPDEVYHVCIPSWNYDDTYIVYQDSNNQIKIVNIKTKEKKFIAIGESPVFSPKENKIAYRKENRIFIIDIASKESIDVYTDRWAWLDGGINREMYWSSDGKYILFFKFSGLTGKKTAAYILDVENRKTRKLFSDYISAALF